jgi:excisionase family DNA binding protein
MKSKSNCSNIDIKNLSKREAAQMLGISVRKVEKLIYDRSIDHVRIGSRVLIPYAAIEHFNEAHTVKAYSSNSEAFFQ